MTNLAEDDIDQDALNYERSIAREERPVRIVNPVIASRNRRNKQRGRAAERAWARLIEQVTAHTTREVPPPEVRGGLGGADVTWDPYPLQFAFEIKQRRDDWPSSTIIKNALAQATRNAGSRTPVVVGCMTKRGLPREWRVYIDGAVMEGGEWIAWALAQPFIEEKA